jgi:hypothetical protein
VQFVGVHNAADVGVGLPHGQFYAQPVRFPVGGPGRFNDR